jgi:hypothetical protein
LIATTVSGDQLLVDISPQIPHTCSSSICRDNIVQKIRETIEKFQQLELAIRLADGQIVNIQAVLCSIIGE